MSWAPCTNGLTWEGCVDGAVAVLESYISKRAEGIKSRPGDLWHLVRSVWVGGKAYILQRVELEKNSGIMIQNLPRI